MLTGLPIVYVGAQFPAYRSLLHSVQMFFVRDRDLRQAVLMSQTTCGKCPVACSDMPSPELLAAGSLMRRAEGRS